MTIDAPSFFELSKSRLLDHWGDYGSTLCNGMLRTGEGGEQRLDRTGPFVPPISFPPYSGVVVVTSEARQKLEASGMSGVGEFRPLRLGKIAFVDWQKWDTSGELGGDLLPFNGEPEEYILHNPHDAETAAGIEPLWTWHPLRIGSVSRLEGAMQLEGIMGRHDVFRLDAAGWNDIIVSENGMRCVRDLLGDWVTFDRIGNAIVS